MACKIIGRLTTLPHSWDCTQYGPVDRDEWFDIMMTAHDNCGSYWCFHNWVFLVVHTFKDHGLPIPRKGSLPMKEYSLVLLNDLAHMMETTEMPA